VLLAIALSFYIWSDRALAWAGALIGISFVWLKLKKANRSVVTSTAACLVIFTSFAAGWDVARLYVVRGAVNRSIQTDAPEPLAVGIIRGVLYYEPKSNEVGFIKWSSIIKVSKIW
jgi:hypothetical protein